MRYEIGRMVISGDTKSPTPNIRFISWEALRDYLQYTSMQPIDVDIDELTDYWLSPSMNYFEVGSSGFELANRACGGYAILKRSPSGGYPDYTGEAGTPAANSCFLVFITRIEYNQLTDATRYYYTVDWWDTLLMWDMKPEIYGICERAHVDDLTTDRKPNSYYFTEEIELAIPTKSILSLSTPATPSAVVVSPRDANAGIESYPIYYLYIVLANKSSLQAVPTAAAQPSTWNGIQVGVGTPSIVVCTLFSAARNQLVSPHDDRVKGYSMWGLTNEHILAMYISTVPPSSKPNIIRTDSSNFYINELPSSHTVLMTLDGSDRFDDDNTIDVYSVQDTTVAAADTMRNIFTRLKTSITTFAGEVNYVAPYINGGAPLTPPEDFTDYLDKYIVKAHMYPYAYYTFIRGSTSVDLISEWLMDGYDFTTSILHDKATDTFVLLMNFNNASGVETIYTFDYPTIFDAPYKQSWLERTTSLESGAFQIAGSAVGIISSAASTAFGAMGLGAAQTTGQALKAGGQTSGGISGVLGGTLSLIQGSIAYDRERRLTDKGYFVRGSLPTQAISSLNGSSGLYLKYTQYSADFRHQLTLNLHYFGYHTLVNAGDIVNGGLHHRNVFNYIKTTACNVTSGALPLDVKSDIKDMFDRGVWLFSDYNLNFEKSNLPKGVQ